MQVASGSWDNETFSTWADQAIALRDEAAASSDAASLESGNRARQSWKEWADLAFCSGAGLMHRHTRRQRPFVPHTVLSLDGAITADPREVLRSACDEREKLWQVSLQAPTFLDLDGDRSNLGQITHEQLLTAVRAFPRRSSYAKDGFHPRHFGLLCPSGLDALATLLLAIETAGLMPTQTSIITFVLIPKGTDKPGRRPVALFSGLFRLWSKVRLPFGQRWLDCHRRDYIACGRERSPEVAVWRLAVRNEVAAAEPGLEAASVLWDMRKFFECFDLRRLCVRALSAGIPPALIRLAINTYMGLRVVRMEQRYQVVGYAERGLPAGCVLALLWVAVYTIPCFDGFIARSPSVFFDQYVDDLIVSAVGTKQQIVLWLKKALLVLRDIVVDDIGAAIAMEKADIATSSRELALALKQALGDLAGSGPVSSAAVHLGINFRPMAPRTSHTGRKHGASQKRWQTALGRQKRIRLVRRRLPARRSRLTRIFFTGVRPALAYGACVNGCTDGELRRTRKLLLSAQHPCGMGTSWRAKLALLGDPSGTLAFALALRWVHEVWAAGTMRDDRAFSIIQLRQFWQAAVPHLATSWRAMAGPLAAVGLSLKRFGWDVTEALAWVDDLGCRRNLLDFSPAMWQTFFRASVQRQLERDLACQVRIDVSLRTGEHPLPLPCLAQEDGPRVLTDVARAACAPASKKLDPLGKTLVACFYCDGIWTRTRLQQAGYVVDSLLCDLCGLEPDTLDHRMYRCTAPEAVQARTKAAGRTGLRDLPFSREMTDADKLLWLRGISLHPVHFVPPVPDEALFRVSVDGAEVEGAIQSEDLRCLSGDLFWDGSCRSNVLRPDEGSRPAFRIPELARSTWAVTQVTPAGEPLRVYSGVVWNAYCHTPQAAEHVGFATACTYADGDYNLYGDCKGIVDILQKPLRTRLAPSAMYGGLHRILARPGGGRLNHAQWVKAHTADNASDAEVAALTPQKRFYVLANREADRAASTAHDLVPALPQSQADLVMAQLTRLQCIQRIAAAVLRLWPRLPDGLERIRNPNPRRPGRPRTRVPLEQQHSWGDVGRGWRRCELCWRAVSVRGQSPLHSRDIRVALREKCCREPLLMRKVDQSHCLAVFTDGVSNIAICTFCGAYGTRRAVLLAKPCPRFLSSSGKKSINRVTAGKHPCDKPATKETRIW